MTDEVEERIPDDCAVCENEPDVRVRTKSNKQAFGIAEELKTKVFYVVCTSCMRSTRAQPTVEEAIDLWNERQEKRKATAGDERRDT